MWVPRLAAFGLAALAAASVVYWGLKWPGKDGDVAAASLASAEAPAIDPQVLARALGGGLVAQVPQVAPAAGIAASRLTLMGVVATNKQVGTALISVDGKPARPYRVGAKVEDELVLLSVGTRRASLSTSMNGPPSVVLELPLLSRK